MPTVVGIKFKPAGKTYFFNPNEFVLEPGCDVIVETARGLEFATVSEKIKYINEENFTLALRPVIRLASDEDKKIHQKNIEKSKEALPICQAIINEHELGMNLISADYNFDNSQLLFIYTAKERVDFRNLLKHLAATFHTRIELRQIGDRDEPKLVGGVGICGRNLCCQQFLNDFSPISIKMAKEQNLSLNTSKISGFCGKLLCCLAYENEHYEERNRLKKEAEAKGEVFDDPICPCKGSACTKNEAPLLEEETSQIEIIEYQPTISEEKDRSKDKEKAKKPFKKHSKKDNHHKKPHHKPKGKPKHD